MAAEVEAVEAGGAAGGRLDLKSGFSCNNRCTFCVQGDKREHIPDRTTDELRALLEARAGTVSGVVFTGGEVTLRSDLVELVRYARGLGYRSIQIQTNGRRLSYRPYVRALREAGATEIAAALHGSGPAIHDALTRARGSFLQTSKGLRNSALEGLTVISNSVVVQDNLRDLPRLVALLCDLGVHQLQLAYVHPEGTAKSLFSHVVPRFSEAMPFVKAALDVARRRGVLAHTEAIPYCLMQGYEEHVVEDLIPDTCVVDAPMTIEDYTDWRWTEGKAKGPDCARCTWAARCEGPWREYPDGYGWAELVPRTDPPR